MRSFVFTDAALSRQAGRFVWLAMDTEKTVNAPLKKRLSVDALPTFLIVDPVSEAPVLRWVGGATVPQLQKILADGARAVQSRGAGLEQALASADRLYAQAKYAEAAKAYRGVLAKASRGWGGYGRASESLLYALQRTHESRACTRAALEAFPRLRLTPSAANVVSSGLGCALELPPDDPSRPALVAELVRLSHLVLADRTTRIAADDRSSVYDALVEERSAAKDEGGKKKVAAGWAAFLEGEASRAKTPDARAVFDPHRLGAYLALGEPEKAVPMLEASERDLPDDYNPPARLAVACKAMGRYDEALAASDRALAKAYGPRKLNVLRTRAEIYAAKGDAAAAKRTWQEAVEVAEALPEGQRSDATIAALKKRLEGIK